MEKTWRKYRLKERSKHAWNWCMNNNRCKWDNDTKEYYTDLETVELVSENWHLAECIFSGTNRKRMIKCKQFVENVVKSA